MKHKIDSRIKYVVKRGDGRGEFIIGFSYPPMGKKPTGITSINNARTRTYVQIAPQCWVIFGKDESLAYVWNLTSWDKESAERLAAKIKGCYVSTSIVAKHVGL